ncbi:MAG: peptidylprolyl isomerase [Polyangiaceae bacterium]|nr:peptidylprolyl isomerase [Polyangiaceae bacterium]
MRSFAKVSLRPVLGCFLAVSLSAACNTQPPAGVDPEPKSTTASNAPTTPVSVAAPVQAPAAPAPGDIPAPSDVGAAPADAAKTASGLASKVLTPGTGKDHPGENDTVKVHYTGWTKEGKMFDSSVARKEPAEFPVGGVIKGWVEGLQLMVLGEKRRLWIPATLAYGDHPRGGAPSGDLVFDVELLEIKVAPKPPAVPDDVKAAPASAKKTASGLRYRVLKAGTGKKHPEDSSTVTVQYTGWTTDGKMFDSSVVRGKEATFGVGGVIKGWTEGLKLMVEGEKTRFWIPGSLAYGDTPNPNGAPTGTLVFDIELVSFK